MRKFIAQNFGNQLYDFFNKSSLIKYYNELKPVVYSNQKKIQEHQFHKLKLLLEHAYTNVPFYRKRFNDLKMTPSDIRSLEDFAAFPSLKRDDLQNHWQEIIASNYNINELSKGSSSGSTGVPVVYYKDKNATSAGKAAHQIGWEFSGWELGLKGLHIWGNPTTVNKDWKRLSSRMKVKVFNHYKYPSYKLTEKEKFNELVDLINKEKYDFLDGYTNAIYLLANFIKTNDIKIHKSLFVFTTGENLQAYQRVVIEEALGKVYDEYGSSEINGVAYECSQCKKYHIIEPHVVVEYGKAMSTDGECPLIITDLDNFGFPLIRYENGDAAVPVKEDMDKINCKIQLKRIEGISGRISDIVNLSNGGVLSVPSFFGSMLLKQLNGIKQYQIEKVKEDQLIIKLVVSNAFEAQSKSKMEDSLQTYLGDVIKWEIQIVDKIEVSKTGKYKLLIDKTK